MQYLLFGRLKLFFGTCRPLDDLVEMMFGEGLKMVLQNSMCQRNSFRLRFFDLQLLEQTLLQVCAGYAGWVELFDLLHDIRHLLVGDTDLFLKHQIIYQLLRRTAKIAVIVNIAQHPFGDMPLGFGHVGQIDL